MHNTSHMQQMEPHTIKTVFRSKEKHEVPFKDCRYCYHCNALQHTATQCNTVVALHHTASHCNTLQHTATLHHCDPDVIKADSLSLQRKASATHTHQPHYISALQANVSIEDTFPTSLQYMSWQVWLAGR